VYDPTMWTTQEKIKDSYSCQQTGSNSRHHHQLQFLQL